MLNGNDKLSLASLKNFYPANALTYSPARLLYTLKQAMIVSGYIIPKSKTHF
jgi:hypothetical protein